MTLNLKHSRLLKLLALLALPLLVGGAFYKWNVARQQAYVPLLSVIVPPAYPPGGQGIDAIAFSPNSRTLAGSDRWNRLRLFDARTGKVSRSFKRLHEPEYLAWSWNGKLVAGAGHYGMWVVNTVKGAVTRRIAAKHDAGLLPYYQGQHIKCYLSSGATLGAMAQWQDSISVWDLVKGKPVFRLRTGPRPDGLKTEVQGLAFSQDGKIMAVARLLLKTQGETTPRWNDPMLWRNAGLEITVHDTRNGQILRVIPWNEAEVWRNRGDLGLCFSPRGRMLAASDNRVVKLWNADTGQLVRTLKISSGSPGLMVTVQKLAFSADATLLSRIAPQGETDVWNVTNGQHLHTFYSGDATHDVKFSPDGKLLASSGGSKQGFIKLWDIRFLRH
ncbi:MAG TPA: hypothetical protein VF600_06295 [Abditibacteriaceae bacterium]|jgi:WD40 repeat protein